jgi:hypothetical protein
MATQTGTVMDSVLDVTSVFALVNWILIRGYIVRHILLQDQWVCSWQTPVIKQSLLFLGFRARNILEADPKRGIMRARNVPRSGGISAEIPCLEKFLPLCQQSFSWPTYVPMVASKDG